MMAVPREGGFTLLEVLVAFVIAAMALGVFYEGILTGLHSSQIAGSYEEAISLAKSHMAELNQRQGIQPLETEGPDGPVFHYRIRVTRLAQAQLQRSLLDQDNNKSARQAALYGLSVTETWTQDGHQRTLQLQGETMAVQTVTQ
jgi:general secretion pathway protein I